MNNNNKIELLHTTPVKTMIAATTSNNHADLPQPSRQSLAKSHDDGDVKYFFQRPEQEINSRQTSTKWSGDDSALEQVTSCFI